MSFNKIDLFSSSFNFNIGGSNIQKGTIAGATFTIIILALTLSYFIYVIELYFSNNIEPVYRAQNIINNQTQQIDLNQNIYAIKFNYLYPPNENLKYIFPSIVGTYKNDTNKQFVNINTKKCDDPNLDEQFVCLDQIQFSDDNQKSEIQNFDYNYKLAQIGIYVQSCQDQVESQKKNCASQQEIDKIVNGSEIVLKMSLSYFDIYQKKMNQSYQTINILISSDQLKKTNIKQQNQKTTIKDGLFIQQESNFIIPFNYNIDNQSLNRQFFKETLGFGAYSFVNLEIDQIYSQISIQYPTIPSVLALVNSVFNMLVFLGFFLKFISQSSLQEDFFVILIKNVYQDIYQQIYQSNNLKKSNSIVSQQNKSFISNQTQKIQDNQLANIKGKEKDNHQNSSKSDDQKLAQSQVIKEQENNIFDQEKFTPFLQQNQQICINIIQKSESEMGSNKEKTKFKVQNVGPKLSYSNQLKQKDDNQSLILSKDCFEERNDGQVSIVLNNQNQPKQELNKIQNIIPINQKQPIKQKDQDESIKKLIFGFRSKDLKSQVLNKQRKQKIEEQLIKDLDILQFYKDIMFLKKAIMMLLTQDQLASINFIGYSSYLLDLKQPFLEIQTDKLSHFEQQFSIINSDDLQSQYFQKFLRKCYDKENINEIDQRILNSLSKSYIN
ncbi:AMP-binding enzyme family protein (macronuclear) [Tetrahymena thermophila SB210]|uniref:AMP-binding enzyme family protein n=1 Tax=Tetrahymena thermophila (strain SB210) TaxID=312017 RepID=Q23Q54_TETTS|nr:AMP-binding enzyme family protein [Tetrahymena thermophila SB210]EAR98730.2 AMP-binding enzyme family protein [Tetrahymena thermophila SB210]|eukprot:XP_001018975.2 AMP-binding enzyme family protein [Tetrahymena thermophila SB210]